MSRARDFADLAGSADAGGLTGRNIVINGAQLVDQRNTTTTYSNTGGFGAADRISFRRDGTWTTTTFDISQEDTSGLNEFPKCSQIKVQDAVANPNANNHTWCGFRYAFEGNEIQQLAWGTSDAQAITLSFHVKSSVAGTYCVGFRLATDDRSYVAEYTINSADTFERKTITVPAPTTSEVDTKFVNDNSQELALYWVASGNTTGTSNNRGSAGWNDGAKYYTANQANAFPAINDVLQITGIQLEVGEQATPFEHRSFDEERRACYRYFFQFGSDGSTGVSGTNNNSLINYAYAKSTTAVEAAVRPPLPMRVQPTVTVSATGDVACHLPGFVRVPATALSTQDNLSGFASVHLNVTIGSNAEFTAGKICFFEFNGADKYLRLDAEL